VWDPATEERIGQNRGRVRGGHRSGGRRSQFGAARLARRQLSPAAELLHEVSRQVMAARPLVAEMLTREMGKPYKESFDEVAWSASAIDYYAEIARHENAKCWAPPWMANFISPPGSPRRGRDHPAVQLSACLLCWQAAAALASRQCLIIKPSDLTTLTTLQSSLRRRTSPGWCKSSPGRRRRQALGRALRHPHGGLHRQHRDRTPVAETCGRLYKRH